MNTQTPSPVEAERVAWARLYRWLLELAREAGDQPTVQSMITPTDQEDRTCSQPSG